MIFSTKGSEFIGCPSAHTQKLILASTSYLKEKSVPSGLQILMWKVKHQSFEKKTQPPQGLQIFLKLDVNSTNHKAKDCTNWKPRTFLLKNTNRRPMQYVCSIKDFYQEYIKNSYKSIEKWTQKKNDLKLIGTLQKKDILLINKLMKMCSTFLVIRERKH